MQSGGCYTANASLQARGAEPALELLALALERVQVSAHPLAIVDYGSAQGGNSLRPMAQAIRAMRGRVGADTSLAIIHTDQPENDFSALFCLLRDHPDSYLDVDPQVFPFAIGRSFYGQVMPTAAVTVGWSSFAVHWLSSAPVRYAGHVWPPMAAPEVRSAFKAHSTEDWRAFLTHRAAELVPGGCLVVVQPVRQVDGSSSFPVLMAWVQDELEGMAADGMIEAAEFGGMTIIVYERTPSAVRAPFADGPFQGLCVRADVVQDLPDPYWTTYETDGDATLFAARTIGFFQAAFLPSLLAALDRGRDETFRRAFSGRLLAGLRQRLLEAPQPLVCPLATQALLLEKA